MGWLFLEMGGMWEMGGFYGDVWDRVTRGFYGYGWDRAMGGVR
jgi:hypothetical protein